MFPVRLPGIDVAHCESQIINDHKVLGVLLLRRLGEIEGAGDDGVRIDDHDLVVSNGMGRVDEGDDAGMGNEVS